MRNQMQRYCNFCSIQNKSSSFFAKSIKNNVFYSIYKENMQVLFISIPFVMSTKRFFSPLVMSTKR